MGNALKQLEKWKKAILGVLRRIIRKQRNDVLSNLWPPDEPQLLL